jgi:cell division protein FtsW
VASFRSARIVAWLDPESMSQDTGYQTIQGLYAIGSGGIWGKGLGQSMQKLNFLPEAQNDMIFSIICEELGLFGAFAIILMFVMLLWRMMVIANNAEDLFGALLVVGVMGHIAIQAVLNIAVVTGSIPNTGVSLPFISYGGSSVIFLLIEVGMVLSVAGRIQLKT